MKTVLHVDCGTSAIQHLPIYFQSQDWEEIRYDVDEAVQPDIIGRIEDISLIDDLCISTVYSSHNVEHVSSFAVPTVLAEFYRVLKSDGFAAVLCPDIFSVAEAIIQEALTESVYISPAGPITPIDIIYGYQADIQRGNLFMAHKAAFTAQTLSEELARAGFAGSIIVRDIEFGLHAVATKSAMEFNAVENICRGVFPHPDFLIELLYFGYYSGHSF